MPSAGRAPPAINSGSLVVPLLCGLVGPRLFLNLFLKKMVIYEFKAFSFFLITGSC